jgi:MerR family transcriptional regulator, copper efflux regulator
MTMAELVAAAADARVSARFVRFLIAEGTMPPPRGGRAHAEYGEDHLRAIRRYLGLRDLGLTATRTKEVVAGASAAPLALPIAPGLTLMIDPDLLQAPAEAGALTARIAEAVELVKPPMPAATEPPPDPIVKPTKQG